MLYTTLKLLSEEEVKGLRERLLNSPGWISGKNTATGTAKTVKNNLELSRTKEKLKFSEEINNYLFTNPSVNDTIFPRKLVGSLFARTAAGMNYGPHLDDPTTIEGRRDISFTFFLTNPKEYEGGELIIYIQPEKKIVKLQEGEIIFYPTKYLHEVKTVNQGERMVCVGWIESMIPRDEDRDSLRLFKSGLDEIVAKDGYTQTVQKLHIAYNNIKRGFLG